MQREKNYTHLFRHPFSQWSPVHPGMHFQSVEFTFKLQCCSPNQPSKHSHLKQMCVWYIVLSLPFIMLFLKVINSLRCNNLHCQYLCNTFAYKINIIFQSHLIESEFGVGFVLRSDHNNLSFEVLNDQ